ncbi:MAG TPA: cellulase family glycosylhydrolase [Tepidisphaeraceae bacterium]|jgi:hypothetical protein|nr:cellulase family glycosylhydrolase [Tepidisphaeraceae bacterium]
MRLDFLIILLAVLVMPRMAGAAEDYLRLNFEGELPTATNLNGAELTDSPQRGRVLHARVRASEPLGRTVLIPLPIERLAGKSVWFGADVRIEGVAEKPQPWNGVKVMLVIETPHGKNYPQPEVPTGSLEWARYSSVTNVPHEATAVTLVLGLEAVTGDVWFDNVYVTHRKDLTRAPAGDQNQPIFRGHDLPRLRGAMAGNRLTEADIAHFAREWNGNLLRWQLFEAGKGDRPLDQYDAWLETELAYFDQVLNWCRKHGVLIALDLHSPPGGEAFEAGYITGRGDIFRKPEAQAKFVEVWRRIAERYKGNDVIWGFDLMNEPDDTMLAEGCLDWQQLAERAGRAIREVDPARTLVIEPSPGGGPAEFAQFQPLDLPRCVYSFHVYRPHEFTHQGIQGHPAAIEYPGTINGQRWDKAALRAHLAPAIEFANRYRVHMFVGEFSAIRTAPDGSAARYLADVTALLEELGYDWTYHAYREWHGWSLEHEGPLNAPRKAAGPTDRQRVITRWLEQNELFNAAR